MRTAAVIRHVGFEDLGSYAGGLAAHGYDIRYYEAGLDDPAALDSPATDLLVILGGPIGVYQTEAYPFLAAEIKLARSRIAAARPTLGICLGAQIMARALDTRVIVAEKDEVGWAPLELTAEGRDSPLRHLQGVPVLHWHGDRFELPAGAEGLAATPDCPHQAFRIGANVLALQFHPEVCWPEFERWLIAHVRALVARGESVARLREESQQCLTAMTPPAKRLLEDWLAELASN